MITYETPNTVDDKFRLMEFVYNNTNSFILNTFGYVWESRCWWNEWPIMLYKEDGNIIGLHAFTCNTKYEDTLKTYYIVVDKNARGKGIAKKLTLAALYFNKHRCKNFFVNSENGSDGVQFYSRFYKKFDITTSGNQFQTEDVEFRAPIQDILKYHEKTI